MCRAVAIPKVDTNTDYGLSYSTEGIHIHHHKQKLTKIYPWTFLDDTLFTMCCLKKKRTEVPDINPMYGDVYYHLDRLGRPTATKTDDFYRTQVDLGSDSWVRMSVRP